MVEFVLKNRTANRLVYEYYPEGDDEKLPGIISVWIKKRDIVLDVAAEDDYITFSATEEINSLKDSLDEVYAELDMVPESDDWESLEGYDSYYYADKVIDELSKYMYVGEFHNSGTVIF